MGSSVPSGSLNITLGSSVGLPSASSSHLPGIGRFFVDGAFNRDYTLVLGTVLFYATLIILLNLLVDILQVWLNPKLRFE